MAKITKETALEIATKNGIDFSKDVFQLSISEKSTMAEIAKKVGYKKSKTATVSTGSAFFLHLQKFHDRDLYTACIFEESTGRYHYCNGRNTCLDSRGKGFATKKQAMQSAKENGYKYAAVYNRIVRL